MGADSPRYTVHETDVLMAGSWTVSAFGPVDHGGVDGIKRALRTAMSVGPSARLGLIPDPHTRRWTYDPQRLLDAVREGPALTPENYRKAMADFIATRNTDEPIAIELRGDHVLVYIDHGIGDGQMTLNLSQTLASPAARRGVVPPWARETVEQQPLLRSALGWYGHKPSRLAGLRSARPTTTDLPDAIASIPWAPSYSAAYAASTEAQAKALQAWRKTHCPDVSVSALFFATLAIALRAENVPVDDTIKVLFNIRRYLPPERTSLANLAAGIDLHLDDATDPAEIGRTIETSVQSGRPIANLVAGTLKSRLGRLTTRRTTGGDTVAYPGRIRLALTDMGRSPQISNIAWTAGAETAQYAALVTPAGPESITIALGRLGHSFKVTASFHDNVVDADAVQRALDAACTRSVELLESQT